MATLLDKWYPEMHIDNMPKSVWAYCNLQATFSELSYEDIDWLDLFKNINRRKFSNVIKIHRNKVGNNGCVYCLTILESNYTLDHVVPVCYGGLSILSNLVPACSWCNNFKGIQHTKCDYCWPNLFTIKCLLNNHEPNLMNISRYIMLQTLFEHGLKSLTNIQLWMLDN